MKEGSYYKLKKIAKSPYVLPGLIKDLVIPTKEHLDTEKPVEHIGAILANIIADHYGHTTDFFFAPRLKESVYSKKKSDQEQKSKYNVSWKRADKVYFRYIFWYIMKAIYKDKVTYQWLAKFTNRENHTTVMTGLLRYEEMLDKNEIIPMHAMKRLNRDSRNPIKPVYTHNEYAAILQKIRTWL